MHNILVVDDEILIGEYLENSLSYMGYNVIGVAHSGKQAIGMAKKYRPDIILMDIVMQGEFDGIEAAEIITDEMDVPIIFITGYEEDEFIQRAKEVNPYGYLLKPFHEQELKASIEIAIRRSRNNQTVIPPESSTYGALTLDANSCITHVNQKILEMYQMKNSDLQGLSIYEIIPNFPNLSREKNTAKQPHLKQASQEKRLSFYGLRKDGSSFPIELYLIPYFTPSEEIEVYLIVDDLSDCPVSHKHTKEVPQLRNITFNYINLLKKLIPVCSGCKKIRDTGGEWWEWDHYMKHMIHINFTHTICPECARRIYPELFPEDKEQH